MSTCSCPGPRTSSTCPPIRTFGRVLNHQTPVFPTGSITKRATIRSTGWADGKKGDYDKSIADYTEAIRLNPKDGALYRGGLGLRGEGRIRPGDCRLHPGHPAGSEGCPGVLRPRLGPPDQRRHDQAIADYTEAIRLNPKDSLAYCGRGLAYGKKVDIDKSIADYTEAIRLNDKSIADYTEAIRLNPRYARAFRGRGWAYWQRGDYNREIADYTEAIRLNPKDGASLPDPWLGLRAEGRLRPADCRLHGGHPAESERWRQSYRIRGWAYGQKGDYDQQIADCTEAIRLNERDYLAYQHRGWAYRQKDISAAALAKIMQATSPRPGPASGRAYGLLLGTMALVLLVLGIITAGTVGYWWRRKRRQKLGTVAR